MKSEIKAYCKNHNVTINDLQNDMALSQWPYALTGDIDAVIDDFVEMLEEYGIDDAIEYMEEAF